MLNYVKCKTCYGTGVRTEISTNDKGYKKADCIICGGKGITPEFKDAPENAPGNAPESAAEMGSDEYEAERLGTVIFLIAACLGGLYLGVFMNIANSLAELPPWYYLADVVIVGLITWRFHSFVANLAWIGVALAGVVGIITFLVKFVF